MQKSQGEALDSEAKIVRDNFTFETWLAIVSGCLLLACEKLALPEVESIPEWS